MTQTPEPTDKLDTATTVAVSGPEDATVLPHRIGGSVRQPAALSLSTPSAASAVVTFSGACLSRMH
jgi:hypothetical protein